MGPRVAALALAGAAFASPASAQDVPRGIDPETVVVDAAAAEAPVAWGALAAGERVVAWFDSDVAAARADAGGLDVPGEPPGAVLASFAGGPPFAWVPGRTVWVAPRAGTLAFLLNGRAAHGFSGRARLRLARIDARARDVFPAPQVTLERVSGGVRVGLRDRAGFGVDPRSLALTIRTAAGVEIGTLPWGAVGAAGGTLQLPPPLDLPPGIHTLTATVEDRLGNVSPPATLTFDAR